jgi:4-oxalocrotonate tautomerase family enzyme
MPVVRIDWTEGRTNEQKKILIESITQKISEVTGVDKSRIIILINDFPKTNVGIDGKPRG